jgi:hypothetical protein
VHVLSCRIPGSAWRFVMQHDNSLFRGVYQTYRFSFIALGPTKLLVDVAVLLSVFLIGPPDTLMQIVAVAVVELCLGAFYVVFNPFVDPAIGVLSSSAVAVQVCLLGLMAFQRDLLYDLDPEHVESFTWPAVGMIVVTSVYLLFLGAFVVVVGVIPLWTGRRRAERRKAKKAERRAARRAAQVVVNASHSPAVQRRRSTIMQSISMHVTNDSMFDTSGAFNRDTSGAFDGNDASGSMPSATRKTAVQWNAGDGGDALDVRSPTKNKAALNRSGRGTVSFVRDSPEPEDVAGDDCHELNAFAFGSSESRAFGGGADDNDNGDDSNGPFGPMYSSPRGRHSGAFGKNHDDDDDDDNDDDSDEESATASDDDDGFNEPAAVPRGRQRSRAPLVAPPLMPRATGSPTPADAPRWDLSDLHDDSNAGFSPQPDHLAGDDGGDVGAVGEEGSELQAASPFKLDALSVSRSFTVATAAPGMPARLDSFATQSTVTDHWGAE